MDTMGRPNRCCIETKHGWRDLARAVGCVLRGNGILRAAPFAAGSVRRSECLARKRPFPIHLPAVEKEFPARCRFWKILFVVLVPGQHGRRRQGDRRCV